MATDHLHIKTNHRRIAFFAVTGAVFLFSFFSTFAQHEIVLTDTTKSHFIGRSVYYLEDPRNTYTFTDIEDSGKHHLLKKFEQENPNFGNVETIVWNKFTVRNQSSKKWFLSILNYNIDTLTFFYRDTSGKLHTIITGSSQPLSRREFRTGNYNFELNVPEHTSRTFYLKVQSYLPQYPLRISSEEQFVYDLHINNLLKGIYFGLVFLFIIYNMVLYITLKDKNYLYFNLSIFFTALLMSEHAGLNAILWGDQLRFLWNTGPLILALGSLFFLIFSKSFLQVKKYAPRSDKVIRYVFIPLVVLSMLFTLAGKTLYASVLNQLTGVLILIFMTISATVIYRKGNRFALFYIIACGTYFAGVVIFILKTFAFLPYNFFTSNSMELGSALEMILFSISMADRMNTFKKEKENARQQLLASLQKNKILITEQNKMLEEKVEERTNALQKTLGELEASQQMLEQKNTAITAEKVKSENLLLNILPEEVAEELKQKGSTAAKYFERVTVMFTDFKDFTQIAVQLSPAELVDEIHTCFKAFDEIITRYNIEKIKTIGDAYMCAGGLPVKNENSASDVVSAARDILKFMKAHQQQRAMEGKPLFEIRIGINSGPVVAGIVGVKKFAYDIWGDTVNTASRMESSGEAGKINISGSTYDMIRHQIKCTYRGKVKAKNKGEIDMYFVDED